MTQLEKKTEPKISQAKTEVRSETHNNPQFLSLTAATYAGPLPPPEAFEKYERILPGAADRILKLAENQAAHRQKQQTRILWHQIILAHGGQFCAFVLASLGLSGAIYCAYIGQPLAALFASIGGLACVISPFLNHFNKKQQS